MTVERHLFLQEFTLLPSAEWSPRCQGWLMCRVAEGAGYWLQHGAETRQLAAGDGVLVARNPNGSFRASQLGPLKLQFFTIHPQHLNGLLTVAEWHQFEIVTDKSSSHISIFNAADPVGQKFTRIAAQLQNNKLPLRCALLQLWANAVAGWLAVPLPASANDGKLRDRFRQFVGQMPEVELSKCSLAELAEQLNCSERHFSRLFREEFGVSLRARQIELRLQRARQLLGDSNSKIINVAYESGYRHLGLFNAMFKKRFGVTPGEWRQQNPGRDFSDQPRNSFLRASVRSGVLGLMLGLFFGVTAFAQTNLPGENNPALSHSDAMARAQEAFSKKMTELDAAENTNSVEKKTPIHDNSAPTNAGPRFKVDKYLVMENSLLSPEIIGGIFTNVPAAFGTNVSFDGIREVLGDLQTAYRERGFVTVSVGLPQQKLTNATVKVQVIEGRLAAINVSGNHYYTSNDVLRALPSLHANMILNSRVFQRELDNANASRDRQIYPVIGPGPEPRTSELTLTVKDRMPLHARLEMNNQATPGTPDLRVNFNAQYDNLWDLEHQVGLQYSFSNERMKASDYYSRIPFDEPLIANYSGYYRMPLGGYSSVQRQIDDNPSSFGYSEVTHQFRVPPTTGRPEVTVYASRSVSDTGINFPTPVAVASTNGFTITTNNSGDVVTMNEDAGARFSIPLPILTRISGTLSFGFDYKVYRSISFQTNNAFFNIQIGTDPTTGAPIFQSSVVSQGQSPAITKLNYLPFNFGLNGSVPDKLGTTFFNANANFNVLPGFSSDSDFGKAGYSSKARADYLTLQFGADRIQTIYKDWTVKLHGDGQWANTPLIGNEQYAMGGVASVRGYTDGEAYGDTGWRFSIEPQTPPLNIGMIGMEGREEPCSIRGSIFMDYGQGRTLERHISYFPNQAGDFCGAGFGLTAAIGSHVDGRLTIAWPVLTAANTSAGDIHIYFGVGAQF